MRRFRILALLPLCAMLSGCNSPVLNPSGDIAALQRDLVLLSTALMLLIIIPVMVLTVVYAWHYRRSNTQAHYDPNFDHSMQLELVIWAAPLLIIICLGALTWVSTHLLDPYRPLGRLGPEKPVMSDAKPLQVNVVALDWKWLFIYPQYGVAAVNELAAPLDRAIDFRITASSVMNSFYIPALAGQIYAMPGMETKLHAVINRPGIFEGFSANYSGAGFSGMRFAFHGLDTAAFDKWIADMKAGGGALNRDDYLALERPSQNEPVRRFASVDPTLFTAIVNKCVEPGKMCMRDMAAIDARGGLGLAGIGNVAPLEYDKTARRGTTALGTPKSYVTGLCTMPDEAPGQSAASPRPVSASPLLGAGLPSPGAAGSPRPSKL